MSIILSNRDFADFISEFPEITLPVTITQESQIEFSRQNKSIDSRLINQFVGALSDEEIDEIIPCLRIANTAEIIALIYWKATLMTYEYYLTTFSPNGDIIDSQVIAGIKSNSETVLTRVANIAVDWTIYIAQSETKADELRSDADNKSHYSLELLPTGHIVQISD